MWESRKLKEIEQSMDSITTQEDLTLFLNDPENAQRLNGLVEDIRYALMEYQVCAPKIASPYHILYSPQTSVQQEICDKNCQLIVSLTSL